MPIYVDAAGNHYQDVSRHSPNDSQLPFPSAGFVTILTTTPVAKNVAKQQAFAVNTAKSNAGGPI